MGNKKKGTQKFYMKYTVRSCMKGKHKKIFLKI